MFSIIIPVLHEQDIINETIKDIRTVCGTHHYEIIIVDGSPSPDTLNAVGDNSIRLLTSGTGRAIQMNTGASCAQGDILIFLHADTHLPNRALASIHDALFTNGYTAGAFTLGIHSSSWWLTFIACATSLRSRLTKIPYGDQSIFIRKDFFQKIGGFKEIPLMEDVELMKSIKKYGGIVCILKDKVLTSARRWERKGYIKTTAINHLVRLLYTWGVKTQVLKKIYDKN